MQDWTQYLLKVYKLMSHSCISFPVRSHEDPDSNELDIVPIYVHSAKLPDSFPNIVVGKGSANRNHYDVKLGITITQGWWKRILMMIRLNFCCVHNSKDKTSIREISKYHLLYNVISEQENCLTTSCFDIPIVFSC